MNSVREINYILQPGFIYFSNRVAIVRTVLGSCVAVCLWDKKLRFGGMNHFIHPVTREPSKATAQYGNIATIELIRLMNQSGSKPRNIIAQIFGGGCLDSARGQDVGEKNVQVARDVLSQRSIKIASEDVGGSLGRKIAFDTRTGQVVVFKVQEIRKTDWLSV